MIDFGRAFKAPFEDKDWIVKTLLGLLWGLLVVTSPALYGAQVEYIRGVANGDEGIPGWDGFGKKWVEGFLISIAGFIYALPIVILGAIMVGSTLIPVILSGGDSGAATGLFGGTTCLFVFIAMVYGILVSIFFYGAIVQYAMKGNFGAFFQIGEILGRVRGGSGYWTAWLYALLVSFGGSLVTSLLSSTGIGAILYGAVVYLMLIITGHLFGQWARSAYGITAAAAPAVANAAYAPPAPVTPSAPPAPAPAPAAAPQPEPAPAPVPAPAAPPAAPEPPAPAPSAPEAPAPEPPAPAAEPAAPEPPVAPEPPAPPAE